jgi:hypothetical protein
MNDETTPDRDTPSPDAPDTAGRRQRRKDALIRDFLLRQSEQHTLTDDDLDVVRIEIRVPRSALLEGVSLRSGWLNDSDPTDPVMDMDAFDLPGEPAPKPVVDSDLFDVS